LILNPFCATAFYGLSKPKGARYLEIIIRVLQAGLLVFMAFRCYISTVTFGDGAARARIIAFGSVYLFSFGLDYFLNPFFYE
jgi:hypothetical protein